MLKTQGLHERETFTVPWLEMLGENLPFLSQNFEMISFGILLKFQVVFIKQIDFIFWMTCLSIRIWKIKIKV